MSRYQMTVEMRHKPGALQRLVALLGQRNVEVEDLWVETHRALGTISVVVSIEGNAERAAWVLRQVWRHQDVQEATVSKRCEEKTSVAETGVPRRHAAR